MQQHHRILAYHLTPLNKLSDPCWIEIELDNHHRVELIISAPANPENMPTRDSFNYQKIMPKTDIKLFVFDPLAPQKACCYCLIIYQQRLYRFTLGKYGFQPPYSWQAPQPEPWVTSHSWLNAYKSPFNLTEGDEERLQLLSKTTTQPWYVQWHQFNATQEISFGSPHSNLGESSDRIKPHIANVMSHEFYVLLQQLKLNSSCCKAYCSALITLLNRQFLSSDPNFIEPSQQETLFRLSYDFLFSSSLPHLGIYPGEKRVAAYRWMTQVLFNELSHYRINLEHTEIEQFSREDIEAYHYLSAANLNDDEAVEFFISHAELSASQVNDWLSIILKSPRLNERMIPLLLKRVTDISHIIANPQVMDHPEHKKWLLNSIVAVWVTTGDRLLRLIEGLSCEENQTLIASLPLTTLQNLLTKPEHLTKLLEQYPGHLKLCFLQLDFISHRIRHSELKHAVKALQLGLYDFYQQHPDRETEISIILEKTFLLLMTPPGLLRAEANQNYYNLIIKLQNHSAKTWKIITQCMMALSLCIILFVSVQLLVPLYLIPSTALLLVNFGLYRHLEHKNNLSNSALNIHSAITHLPGEILNAYEFQ